MLCPCWAAIILAPRNKLSSNSIVVCIKPPQPLCMGKRPHLASSALGEFLRDQEGDFLCELLGFLGIDPFCFSGLEGLLGT